MKIKNSQIILVIATFLGVYILLAGYLSILKTNNIKIDEDNQENKTILGTIPQIGAKPLSGEFNQIIPSTTSQTEPLIESKSLSKETNTISVSFQILDNRYELEISENTNVFEAMKKLQDDTKSGFSINYKEYPRMGAFVNEINGIKGKSGAYWIYYVNGKEASVGVSSYILKEGDSILWKQE